MSLQAAADFAWRSASPMAASVSRNCLRMTALLLGLILIITSALKGGLLSKRVHVRNSTPKIVFPEGIGTYYRYHPHDRPPFSPPLSGLPLRRAGVAAPGEVAGSGGSTESDTGGGPLLAFPAA